MTDGPTPAPGDRLAKVIARSGLCSRRDAEEWIRAGRVLVNGKKIVTPAFNVVESDVIAVDNAPLAARAGTRVWLYHKPKGLVVTEKDPEGRPTIFETLEREGLPRVMSVGRLDINTEGLLLLTNDGGLKRVLELPATGWLRKYRVRAHGTVTQAQLDGLKSGIELEGVKYGPIEASLERQQGANAWLEVSLREGKNREVKNILMALGLEVNRLIRVSFGPFQLGDLPVGGVEVVKARVLKDQLGKKLAEKAEADFDSEMPEAIAVETRRGAPPTERQAGRGTHTTTIDQHRFRFTDRAEMTPEEAAQRRKERGPAPSAASRGAGRAPARFTPDRNSRDVSDEPARHIHFDDGREPTVFEEKTYGKKPRPPKPGSADGKPAGGPRGFGKPPRRDDAGPRPARSAGAGERPQRKFGDKPRAGGDAARPPRKFGGDNRPPRDASDKPRAPRTADSRPGARSFKPREGADGGPAGARPAFRAGGAKPFRPRGEAAAAGDRPARAGKPAFRPAGDKPFKPRREGAGADSKGPRTERPRSPRPTGSGAAGERPARAGAGRPAGAGPGANRSGPGRPASTRPGGSRPPRKDGPPRRPRDKS